MPVLVEVGQHQRDRLADQPAAVDGQPVVPSQLEPGVSVAVPDGQLAAWQGVPWA